VAFELLSQKTTMNNEVVVTGAGVFFKGGKRRK